MNQLLIIVTGQNPFLFEEVQLVVNEVLQDLVVMS